MYTLKRSFSKNNLESVELIKFRIINIEIDL